MMSLRDIQYLADQAARRAAREHRQPYVPFDAEEVQEYGRGKRVPFPNLGSYRPPGWKFLEEKTLFVDTTGMGASWEPALDLPRLRAKLLEYLRENPRWGYAIIEEGQFQCYIGVFARVPDAKVVTGIAEKAVQAAQEDGDSQEGAEAIAIEVLEKVGLSPKTAAQVAKTAAKRMFSRKKT